MRQIIVSLLLFLPISERANAADPWNVYNHLRWQCRQNARINGIDSELIRTETFEQLSNYKFFKCKDDQKTKIAAQLQNAVKQLPDHQERRGYVAIKIWVNLLDRTECEEQNGSWGCRVDYGETIKRTR
jgi:hypothetical protein